MRRRARLAVGSALLGERYSQERASRCHAHAQVEVRRARGYGLELVRLDVDELGGGTTRNRHRQHVRDLVIDGVHLRQDDLRRRAPADESVYERLDDFRRATADRLALVAVVERVIEIFAFEDPDTLRRLLVDAGFEQTEVEPVSLTARFPDPDTTAARVRKLVAEAMPEIPEMGAVAKTIGMSPRTLHRRLKEEGTSFAEITDQVRAELAQSYLARGGLSIGEVAALVGFNDSSAFTKAYKRWTGRTPRE